MRTARPLGNRETVCKWSGRSLEFVERVFVRPKQDWNHDSLMSDTRATMARNAAVMSWPQQAGASLIRSTWKGFWVYVCQVGRGARQNARSPFHGTPCRRKKREGPCKSDVCCCWWLRPRESLPRCWCARVASERRIFQWRFFCTTPFLAFLHAT